MSEQTGRIAQMWGSIDPARPGTIVTVVEHIRASLSEGMCPVCLSEVVQDVRPSTHGETAFCCTVCPCVAPLGMIDAWSREVSPQAAVIFAILLKGIWEKTHASPETRR